MAAAKVATAGQATSGEKVAVAIPLAVADRASRSTDPTVKLTSRGRNPTWPRSRIRLRICRKLCLANTTSSSSAAARAAARSRHLAPSGKRILLLERGDYLPREKENWDAAEVFVKNRYVSARHLV